MDFSSALILCRYNGNPIYRKCWKHKSYIYYENDNFYYFNSRFKEVIRLTFIQSKDILALDWEIISNVI